VRTEVSAAGRIRKRYQRLLSAPLRAARVEGIPMTNVTVPNRYLVRPCARHRLFAFTSSSQIRAFRSSFNLAEAGHRTFYTCSDSNLIVVPDIDAALA
jgi:hypothetical protein